MFQRQLAILLASLLSTPAFLGCQQQSPPTRPPEKIVAVKTISVVQEDLPRTTTQPATVQAYYRAEIRSKVSGYVAEVVADIGDYVDKDQVLAIVELPEIEKQRETRQAHVARYKAEEKQAEAGVDLAQANIQSAQAKLSQAKSEMSRAEAALAAIEAEFQRTRDLVERRSLESRVLDEVRKQRDSELANQQAVASAIDSAQAEVTVAKARLLSAEADVLAAKSQTDVANRELEELDVLLAYCKLKAPFAGVITTRNLDPGDLVRESRQASDAASLFVVSKVDKVRVHVPVPEADAAWISPGDSVRLRFPSFPAEEPLEATVTRLSGELDPTTRTMLVEIELPNPERKLLPGMFGEATILLDTKVATKLLPARAIRFSPEGEAFVYLVDDQQQVTVTPITTGMDDGSSIEVTSGLNVGQQVIDAHLKRFVTGDKVTLLTP